MFNFSMEFLKATRIAPDGTPPSAASNLGLFCCQFPMKGTPCLYELTCEFQTQIHCFDESDGKTSRAPSQNGLWMTNIDSSLVDAHGIWTTDTKPHPGRDGWRLSLDHFSPKRQGSKRKARHVSKRAR